MFVPMIDVVELGIVRDVSFDEGHLTVDITPTYSGCPAMQVIEKEIVSTLASHGFEDARIRTVYEKLRELVVLENGNPRLARIAVDQ